VQCQEGRQFTLVQDASSKEQFDAKIQALEAHTTAEIVAKA
jgi:hypothetical protein